MNLTNMKNYGCENAKILSSSINLCLFRFNHIWIPNSDCPSVRPRGPRPVFRIDLTMTWPWIAEKSLSFECRIDVIYVDLIQNEFSGHGDVHAMRKKNLTMEAVV